MIVDRSTVELVGKSARGFAERYRSVFHAVETSVVPAFPAEPLREAERLGWLASLAGAADGSDEIDQASLLGCLGYELGRVSPAFAARLLAHHFCRLCVGSSGSDGLGPAATEGVRWFGLDATIGDDRFGPILSLTDADGTPRLRGSLRFVIGGDSASSWLGAVDLGNGRPGLVLVERSAATSVAPVATIGLRGLGATEATFSEVRESQIHLVAVDQHVVSVVDRAKRLIGPGTLGLTRALLENAQQIAVEYARTRRQNGDALERIPAVRQQLEQIERALGLVRVVAGAYENQATDVSTLFPEVSAATARATDACLQVLGGAGYIVGNGPERLWRDARQLGQLLLRDRW
jgi:alkylation response protein AidB-like acyl-CoA dehydrogenase